MAGRKLRKEKELFYTYLKQNGLKRTHQKDLILETFLNTEGHLSVEDLYALVRKRDKKIGVVTVFRTLKTLTACGIARELSLGDGLTRFEHSYHHPHHHHIICTECHKTIEFVSPELERMQDEIVRKYHILPVHHRLQIYGVCEDCREHRPVPEAPCCDTEMVFARDALWMAHSMETRGIRFYNTAARQNEDPSGREVLEKIAHEEENHLAEIERDLERLNQEVKGLDQVPQFLHFDPADLEKLIPDLEPYRVNGVLKMNARQSFEVALALERHAAEFFREYADKFMETQGKAVFQRFADEELKHYELISRRAEEMLAASNA